MSSLRLKVGADGMSPRGKGVALTFDEAAAGVPASEASDVDCIKRPESGAW